ncbi:MAG TPA: TrmH family RNA methyltransferase [Acidobacteriota bacterium]|nr:TrmH family RNA methyltransferase [Acidobacteriota bacterium]
MPNPAYAAAPRSLAQEMRELARDPAARREARLFLVEGPRGVAEALDAGAVVRWIVVADDRADAKESARLLAGAARRGALTYTMGADKLARSAPSEKGPGLVAACELPEGADDPRDALRRAAGGVVVVSWGLQNPGNAGTIVRGAAAFGAGAYVAVAGADPWGPKAVRASAGAIHRLPAARALHADRFAEELLGGGRRLVAAVARGGADPSAIDWSGSPALLIGAEVAGLPPALEAAAVRATIPTTGAVESLSAPMAATLLLAAAFDARRRQAR